MAVIPKRRIPASQYYELEEGVAEMQARLEVLPTLSDLKETEYTLKAHIDKRTREIRHDITALRRSSGRLR